MARRKFASSVILETEIVNNTKDSTLRLYFVEDFSGGRRKLLTDHLLPSSADKSSFRYRFNKGVTFGFVQLEYKMGGRRGTYQRIADQISMDTMRKYSKISVVDRNAGQRASSEEKDLTLNFDVERDPTFEAGWFITIAGWLITIAGWLLTVFMTVLRALKTVGMKIFGAFATKRTAQAQPTTAV